MAKPQRYPNKIEFWTTEAQFDALQLLTADQLTDRAVHMRQALNMYLRQFGVVAMPPRPNGQHQQPAE